MAQPCSLRLEPAVIDRLQRRARMTRTASRTLAQRYVEEGLRQDEHPRIRFRDGPSGRRAGLVGSGLDVWEVVATIRDNGNVLAESADYLGIPLDLVEAVVAYYGAFRDEIDAEIAENELQGARASQAFDAGRRALDT